MSNEQSAPYGAYAGEWVKIALYNPGGCTTQPLEPHLAILLYYISIYSMLDTLTIYPNMAHDRFKKCYNSLQKLSNHVKAALKTSWGI